MFGKTIWVAMLATLLIFSGCGSSDDSSGGGGSNLSGTVATGEGASATVTLVGSNGNTVVGNSSASGYYSVDASGLTKPIMVRAVLDRDGSTLYSFASSTSGTINVTPLTTYVVDQAAVASGTSGGATQLFTQFEEATPPSNAEANVVSSIETLNIAISSTMQENGAGDFDHFSGEFEANHEGYDAVLDDLDIEVYEDDIIIRTGNSVLDTLNYDIDVNEINASGIVYDITDESPIADANITMVDSAGNSISVVSDANGAFSITVETMRVYDVSIVASGYQTQEVPNVPSFVFSETSVGEIPMFPSDTSGSAEVTGTIIDGRTSSTGIEGVTLTFRDGFGERLDTAVATTSTDSNGDFIVNLPVGVYTVEMQHDSYYTVFRDISVYGSSVDYDFSMLADLSSSTTSTDFFATITLNWDADPSDLDSHLTGPMPDSESRYHLAYYNTQIDPNESYTTDYYDDSEEYYVEYDDSAYVDFTREQLEAVTGEDLSGLTTMDELYTYYSDNLTYDQQIQMDEAMYTYDEFLVVNNTPCSNGELASLDRDRTDSYAGLLPETTTICSVEDGGLYKYYVHHFSGEGTMSSGNAQVTVDTRNGTTRTFTAPSTGSTGTNDIWHVFNIDSDGNIYPVNEMIGIGADDSSLFAGPARTDSRFSLDSGIFENLPSK